MLEIRPDDLDRRARYALMISALIPRPIAWVSTIDVAGGRNLAPFSFFGGISSTPPLVGISVGQRKGSKKDTWRNLEETREAVVHIPTEELAESMVLSSGDFAEGVDEFEVTGLATLPSTLVKPPRIARAPVAMEVRVERILELGDPPDLNGFAIARILLFHVRDDLLVEGRIVPERLRAVGRLGGQSYVRVAETFDVPRPDARTVSQWNGRLEREGI
jgi:flavin reductase (DIM6/NTAB) family NADH-FMN oxidoreductase RutF